MLQQVAKQGVCMPAVAFGFWNFIWASKQAYQEQVSSDPIYVRALP
jgi:spermidine synthase